MRKLLLASRALLVGAGAFVTTVTRPKACGSAALPLAGAERTASIPATGRKNPAIASVVHGADTIAQNESRKTNEEFWTRA